MSVLLYLILPYLKLPQLVTSIQMLLSFTNQKISLNGNYSIIPLHCNLSHSPLPLNDKSRVSTILSGE